MVLRLSQMLLRTDIGASIGRKIIAKYSYTIYDIYICIFVYIYICNKKTNIKIPMSMFVVLRF